MTEGGQSFPLSNLSLGELNQRVMACQDCNLSRGRTRAVPGEGSERAAIFFIGEGPGWHEDQLGRPFVGPAGKFLDELLASVGLKREAVFITNVVKCRPPGNRDPLPAEIEACRKYLDRQLEIIQPRVVVSLGRYSLARFFPGETIGRIHGRWQRRDNTTYFAMYHPAAALHQASLRQTIQADMQKILQALAETENAPQEQQPEQLSLF